MLTPSDYKDLLNVLNRHKVRYLVVGAYAVIYYTEPRYTKDFDIWVEPEIENAKRAYEALKEFGAPLKRIGPEDFMKKTMVYQIGVEPIRVDIIMGLGELDFNLAWKKRKVVDFDGVNGAVVGISELIQAKSRTGRKMDAIDIDNLKQRLRALRKR